MLLNQNPTISQAHTIHENITKLFSTSANKPRSNVPLRAKI